MRKSDVDYLKQANMPIYIYGGGEVAKLVKKELDMAGLTEVSFVVDDSDIQDASSKENVIRTGEKYILIRGFLGSFYMSDEKIMSSWPNCQKVVTIGDIYEPDFAEPLDHGFYQEHKSLFDDVRSKLADELSVRAMDAFIDAKLTLSSEKIVPLVEPVQYFFPGAPWKYASDDVLIDGGAYIGDSIFDFIKLRQNQYHKIIAFEPDKDNYNALCDNLKRHSINRVEALNYGLYKEKTVLKFSAAGSMMSAFSEDGSDELEVETIDHIAGNENVTMIKMDIEGSEMDALQGARETIARCRPILMISAYHKKDDIYEIFNFINTLVADYQFFFKCHKPIAIDAVLYAVPKERLKQEGK